MKAELKSATAPFASSPDMPEVTELMQDEPSRVQEIREVLHWHGRQKTPGQSIKPRSRRTAMGHSTCFVALAIVAIMVSVAPLRAGQVENPEYKAWAGFKGGSSRTLTIKGAGGGGYLRPSGGAQAIQTTLVEVDKDKVMIRVGSPSSGNKPQPVHATMNEGIMKQVGEENVSAMGKTFKCKVWETPKATANAADGSGQKSIQTKEWICDDVPGGLVKVEIYRTTPAPDGQQYHNTETHLLSAYEVK